MILSRLIPTIEFLFGLLSSLAVATSEDDSHPNSLMAAKPSPPLEKLPNDKLHLTLNYWKHYTLQLASGPISDDIGHIWDDLEFFAEGRQLATSAKNVTTVTFKEWQANVPGSYNHAESVFKLFPNVENIYWDGYQAITPSILQSIERSAPNARLFYKTDMYDSESHQALINSTNLHSFEVVLGYAYGRDEVSLPTVFSIFQSSPNLKELSISFYENSCEATSSDFAFNFAAVPNITLPALEVLKVDRYDFKALEDGMSEWSYHLNEDYASRRGERKLPINLEMWKKAMNFSKLHTLDISGYNYEPLASLGGNLLTGLRHLAITGWSSDPTGEKVMVREFLQNLTRPLESLKIWDTDSAIQEVVDVVAQYHCPTLKHFKFGDVIKLPSPELDLLFRECPQLEILDISINERPPATLDTSEKVVMPTWHPYLLAIPKKMKGIKHLAIHFPSPPDEPYDPELESGMTYEEFLTTKGGIEMERRKCRIPDVVDDFVNRNTTLDLFRALRRREVEGPMKRGDVFGLEKLDVLMGDWETRGDAWGGFMGRGDRIRVASYQCFVDDNGGEKCEGSQTRTVNYGGERMDYIS